jgi:N-acetylmuramoyl-L-alanine amidase.
MCTHGRGTPGTAEYLPGPLCQIVFGRNGTVYMVATGVANHAGKGSAPGIPKDAGNHYLIGIEMESSGIAPWDWTADQLRVAPHLGAAIEEWGMQHLAPEMRLQLGHMEYSSQGKIDPAGWPGGMDGLRASINAVLNGGAALGSAGTTEGDDDMALTDDDINRIFNKKIARAGVGPGVPEGDLTLGDVVAWYDANNHAISSAVLAKVTALEGVVSQLAVKQGVTIDYDAIAASVAKAVNDDAAARMQK